MWSFLMVPIGGVAAPSPVPHIPLVKRQPQLFRRTFVSAYEVANRNGLLDLSFHAQVHCQELRAVATGLLPVVRKIAMKRQAVHIFVALLQNLAVPLQVGGHKRPAGPARD